MTDSNYDSSRGSFEKLPNGNSFEVLEFGLRARYNANRRLSFYGGADVVNATSKDATLVRSNSALANVQAGADFLLLQTRSIRLIAEGEGLFSTDPIDIDTTNALTNDGVHHLRASLFAFVPFRWFNTYAHGGLKYRDEGLASLFVWGAGVEKPFRRQFLLGVGVEGFETVIGDELAQTSRSVVTERVNAGSQTFYTHDPALIEARAWAGWSPMNAWQFRLGYGQSLNGVRSAVGKTVFLNLSFNFDPKPDRESFQYHRVQRNAIRKKSRKAIEDFRVDPEKTDPALFDPDDGFEPNVEPDPLTETERLLESR